MVVVKCAGCGYLGVRHKTLQTLASPDWNQRGTGIPPLPIVESMPVCAIGAIDLCKEHAARYADRQNSRAPETPANSMAVVVQQERVCEHSTEWKPGLSPKEHIGMDILRQLRESARLSREADRQFLERQARAQAQWHETDKRFRWLHVTTIMVAAIVSACVGAWLNQRAYEAGVRSVTNVQQHDSTAPAATGAPKGTVP